MFLKQEKITQAKLAKTRKAMSQLKVIQHVYYMAVLVFRSEREIMHAERSNILRLWTPPIRF